MSGSRGAAHGAVALGAALALVSALVPAARHDAASNAASLVLAALALVACRRFDRSRPWRLLAASLALWSVGDAVYGVDRSVVPGLLLSDMFYLAGFAVLVDGVRRLVRERGASGARDGLLDAATVGAAAAVIGWQLFVVQAGAEGPLVARLLQVVYPLTDAMLLGLLAWLAFTPGVRARSTHLLGWFLGAVFAGDVLWAAFPAHGDLLATVADPLYTLGYGLLVAAVAHPSAPGVSSPALGVGRARVHPARVGFVVLAIVAAPLASTLAAPGRWELATASTLGMTVLAAGLVAIRVANLFRQNLRAEQALRAQAHRDPVTGLGNRAALVDVLDEVVIREPVLRSTVFLLFVDLDRFKAVNDSFGHTVGDQLLCLVAERMTATLPSAVAVARFGGDEFAIVLRGDDLDHATRSAWRLHAALVEPYRLGRAVVTVGASIGVAMCDPASSVAELLRDADSAMYRAKRGDVDPVQACDLQLRSVAARRERIAQGLATAVEQGRLTVVYQPIVRVSKDRAAPDRLFGFEALARYTDPTLGAVPPLEFIAVAEETGLIDELGHRILDESCGLLAELNAVRDEPVQMWVNLSARQLEREGIAAEVGGILGRYDLRPASLSLEITESTLMRDSATVAAALADLSRLGVGIALDDFGTGASSLSYLNRLPFTSIKIDRSFVESMDPARPSTSAVAGLLALSGTMGCRSVVEGIETDEQAASLGAIGAELAQGYLFGRPMSRASARALGTDRPAVDATAVASV